MVITASNGFVPSPNLTKIFDKIGWFNLENPVGTTYVIDFTVKFEAPNTSMSFKLILYPFGPPVRASDNWSMIKGSVLGI